MSEQNFCNSCKKNLDMIEFVYENKIYKTCNICRTQKSEKIKKNCCQECGINAVFNFEGEKNGVRCSLHKVLGMINIKDKPCIYNDCTILPSYNFKTETKPIYCFNHKLNDMVNVKNTCCENNCYKYPLYNFENFKPALYCFEHKKNGMINNNYSKCQNS